MWLLFGRFLACIITFRSKFIGQFYLFINCLHPINSGLTSEIRLRIRLDLSNFLLLLELLCNPFLRGFYFVILFVYYEWFASLWLDLESSLARCVLWYKLSASRRYLGCFRRWWDISEFICLSLSAGGIRGLGVVHGRPLIVIFYVFTWAFSLHVEWWVTKHIWKVVYEIWYFGLRHFVIPLFAIPWFKAPNRSDNRRLDTSLFVNRNCLLLLRCLVEVVLLFDLRIFNSFTDRLLLTYPRVLWLLRQFCFWVDELLDSIFCILLELLWFGQLLSSEALPWSFSFGVYLPAGVDGPEPAEACIPEENELQGSDNAGIL